jgi:hypothetical protein
VKKLTLLKIKENKFKYFCKGEKHFCKCFFLGNDKLLMRPKSRRMGLKGGSLLVRKFHAYTHNVKV